MSEFALGLASLGTEIDTSGLESGIDTAEAKAKGGFGRIGDILSGALKVGLAGAVAGFVALGAAIVGGVGDAQESAKLNAATTQTIETMGNAAGRTAQQVSDLASKLSDANGQSLFGDDQIQASENLLLTFGNIKGETFDLATALTVDLAQALGGAPADQAMALGKALDNPKEGYHALARAGLTFSEEQIKAMTTMQDAGNMAGAQAIMIEALNKQVGGQAAAAAGAAGGMVQFKASMGEVFETIGASLLPILNDLGTWLNSPDVKAGIQAFSDGMVLAFGWLHDNIPPIIQIVTTAVGNGIAFITGLFQNDLAPALSENQSSFQTTFNQIVSIVTAVAGIVTTILGALAQFIGSHGAEIKLVLTAAWTVIQAVITGALAIIQGVVQTALALLKGDWGGAWDAIKTMCATVVESLITILKGDLNILLGLFGSSIDDIKAAWNGLVSDMAEVGSSIVEGIIKGVKGMAGTLFAALEQMAQDAYDAFMKKIKGGSPALEFVPAGASIVQGILLGFQQMWPKLQDELGALGKDLIDQVDSIAKDVQGVIADAFGSTATIDRQIVANLDKLKDVLPQYRQYTEGALKEAQQQAEGFLDPTQGAKFFKLKSDQILEYAALQKKLSEAATQEDKDRISAQMVLVNKAQQAELDAFNANFAGATSPTQSLIDRMQKLIDSTGLGLINNPALAELAGLIDRLSAPPVPVRAPYDPTAPGPAVVNNVSVTQLPGEDAESLAERVVRKIEDKVRGRS